MSPVRALTINPIRGRAMDSVKLRLWAQWQAKLAPEIEKRVERGPGRDPCWLWTGSKVARGYGILSIGGSTIPAARAVHEFLIGPVQKGAKMLRSCNNPACVNPKHVKPSTQAEVVGHAAKTGRMRRGSDSPRSKLTDTQVRVLRNRYWVRCESAGALAKTFGIGRRTAYNAAVGITWKHVPMPEVDNRSPVVDELEPARFKLRYRILQRDNFRCQLCGNSAQEGARLHVDHKVAKSRGGSNTEENLWTLCTECNLGKGALPLRKGEASTPVFRHTALTPIEESLESLRIGRFSA